MGIIKKIRSGIQRTRAFTLLIAVIFMAVVLAVGLSLGSLGYKQSVLASSALESQYAFYAADAGLECLLRADEQENDFVPSSFTTGGTEPVTCGVTTYTFTAACYTNGTTETTGSDPDFTGACPGSPLQLIMTARISLNAPSPLDPASTGTRCALVTVYKPWSTGTVYLFSQGYDIPCSGLNTTGRYASRGLSAQYAE